MFHLWASMLPIILWLQSYQNEGPQAADWWMKACLTYSSPSEGPHCWSSFPFQHFPPPRILCVTSGEGVGRPSSSMCRQRELPAEKPENLTQVRAWGQQQSWAIPSLSLTFTLASHQNSIKSPCSGKNGVISRQPGKHFGFRLFLTTGAERKQK